MNLDSVNISFLDNKNNNNKSNLPLIISPRWDNSLDFLIRFCQTQRPWLNETLQKHGAILIRGFAIQSPTDLQAAIQAYNPDLCDTYRGTSPRIVLDEKSAKFVFSAAEVPTHYPIAQHLEMSFLDAPPSQLYFGCLRPSRQSGGETALADFRLVARDLDPELRRKFLDKGVRYTRTNKKVGSWFTYDVSDMLGWPELFGTTDKKEVERLCALEGTPVEWDGDTFVSVTNANAFEVYNDQLVWFNHSQVFHWTTFPAELWFAWQRTREFRLLLQWCLVSIFCWIKYGLLKHKMSLHVTFGDGTEITPAEMQQVRQAVHQNMIFSRWQQSDILLIDNFCVSHGRQPTYDKGRKIAVAWSQPAPKKSANNPQERTPESTWNNDTILEKLVVKKDSMLDAKSVETLERILSKASEATLHERKPSVADMMWAQNPNE